MLNLKELLISTNGECSKRVRINKYERFIILIPKKKTAIISMLKLPLYIHTCILKAFDLIPDDITIQNIQMSAKMCSNFKIKFQISMDESSNSILKC